MKDHAHPIDKTVGANIRRIREMLGMSQERLAEPIGVTFQQVQKYEKGANRVSASKLYLIATLLRVDITDFFVGLEDIKTNVTNLPRFSAEAMRLATDFQKIKSAKARQSIHNVIRAVINVSEQDNTVAA